MRIYDAIKNITNNLLNKIDENTYNLNIQPQASILNVFSRLNYKPWYAIAEFVDNSTQSYISNENALKGLSNFNNLEVTICYDAVENTLTIEDNAYGMEIVRFKDAILLDAKNESQVGRNEFGMGLKTAASWFGNIWEVESTQLGSKNKYSATINIPYLKKSNENSIYIERTDVEELSHGTKIIIKDITKKITAPRTIRKIKELLSSMYRRDINGKNIVILYNGEPITFEEYPILTFRDKIWKKDVDFSFYFDNKEYKVNGFVAIMKDGSFPKAGFALFRQDRVIIGGPDQNYKPSAIFGQVQSQISLKLFGELNMNDFPVNQAKDGFVWDDGLEDAFVENLKKQIQEYIKIADISKKDRASEEQFSKVASETIEKEVSESIENLFDSYEGNDTNENLNNIQNQEQNQNYELDLFKQSLIAQEDIIEDKIIEHERVYVIPINDISKRNLKIKWAFANNKYWFEVNSKENDELEVLINVNHPFFKPYSNQQDFQVVLEKFVIAYLTAEEQAKLLADEKGFIPLTTIRHKMNDYLAKMAKLKED